ASRSPVQRRARSSQPCSRRSRVTRRWPARSVCEAPVSALPLRLYDTYTRGLRDLPAPPGPIRIYSCGPTVYQRIHVGNAVPFVFAMWLRRWLQRTGYEVQLVINITDINDKIYEAAPGASAELARNAS